MKEYIVLVRTIFKRLLWQKGFWFSLFVMGLGTILVLKLEESEETVIYAAIYAEDRSVWQETFAKQDGIIRFYFTESEEELKRDVLNQEAECGYVLTKDLQERFEENDWYWAVEVYESAESMLTGLINEVAFERIFSTVSGEWFKEYIVHHEMFSEVEESILRRQTVEMIQENLSDGSTFDVEKEYMLTEALIQEQEEYNHIFPVRGVIGTGIFLCGLIGAVEVLQDKKAKYFMNKLQIPVAIITIFLPTASAAIFGYVFIVLTGTGGGGAELFNLLLYLLLVVCYCFILQWIVRSERILSGLIPFLILGSLICTPVFIDWRGIMPVMEMVGRLFPLNYYL